jgi:polyferredoxin
MKLADRIRRARQSGAKLYPRGTPMITLRKTALIVAIASTLLLFSTGVWYLLVYLSTIGYVGVFSGIVGGGLLWWLSLSLAAGMWGHEDHDMT